MRKHYNKLVRDNIPQIITSQGNVPATRVLSENEYIKELNSKLLEEVSEYLADENPWELCDIIEVVDAILKAKQIPSGDFNKMRYGKNRTNGAFYKRIFLKYIDTPN